MQSAKAAPKVAFGALVENGFIKPGTQVFDKKRRWVAKVRADGSLAYEKQTGSRRRKADAPGHAGTGNGPDYWGRGL